MTSILQNVTPGAISTLIRNGQTTYHYGNRFEFSRFAPVTEYKSKSNSLMPEKAELILLVLRKGRRNERIKDGRKDQSIWVSVVIFQLSD